MLNRITLADLVVIALLAGLGIALLGSAGTRGAGGRVLTVKSLGGETLVHDLGRDAVLRVEGAIGTTVIVVEDRQAAFTSSPCKHQLCVGRGKIGRAGEWVLCLPNGVIAEISGEDDYDGITP
jgi:hypothetical protein